MLNHVVHLKLILYVNYPLIIFFNFKKNNHFQTKTKTKMFSERRSARNSEIVPNTFSKRKPNNSKHLSKHQQSKCGQMSPTRFH